MAKGIYIGIDGTAHKIKKLYVGIDNIARQIKKAYVGVDGVAKLIYASLPSLVYYGTTSSNSITAGMSYYGSFNDYFFVAGGLKSSSSYYSTAYTYDSSLTRKSRSSLSAARCAGTAVANDSYIILGGGHPSGGTAANTVEAYNTSFTKSSSTLSSTADYLAATNIENYSLFAGGRYGSSSAETVRSSVTAFTTSLTKSSATALSVARQHLGGASIGNYALFAGGSIPASPYKSNVVDTYNTSLTKGTATSLTTDDSSVCLGVTSNNYAVFFSKSDINAYNASLTQTHLVNNNTISSSQWRPTGFVFKDFILVAGLSQSTIVSVFDLALTQQENLTLSVSKYSMSGGTVGDYALFAGGRTSMSAASGVVDVFTIE